jgi:hypothetical protein
MDAETDKDMEADWSAEIGPGLPEICVPWEGFVDLRLAPEELQTIPEAARSPGLAKALASLNGEGSPVFTAKCDLWSLGHAEIDPDEFDAVPEDARCGVASYIDLLPRDYQNLSSFTVRESWAKELVAYLRKKNMKNGRVDLVIRTAVVSGHEAFGITLYAAGCGPDTVNAQANWEAVLTAAVLATIETPGAPSPAGPLTGE